VIVRPTSMLAPAASVADNGFDDTFDGSGAMKARWTLYDDTSNMTVTQAGGRYHALVDDNTGDQQLWYLTDQARMDWMLLTFPFEVIATNIGIGTVGDTQTANVPGVDTHASPWQFCGVCVHVLTMATVSYRLWTVGHRGGTHYTIESKNSLNGANNIADGGADLCPLGRADIRLVGNADSTITPFYRLPGDTTWLGSGAGMPDAGFQSPEPFAATANVGLLSYTFGLQSEPFVGTCDAWTVVSDGA